MFDAKLIQQKFLEAQPFGPFVEEAAKEDMDQPWRQRYELLALDQNQQRTCDTFKRTMPVLCLTGPWCGDCALQGAAMQRIAEAARGLIDLRFLNRNDHAELQVKVRINQGMRVPVTFFMAEDFEPVALFGDRTLSRYRSMARKALGEDAVPTPPPQDPVRTVLQETLDEFERVQLLLRLSGRLRQKHAD